ncbi:MAG: hypothetical protein ABSE59_04595, partial [Opitutaceae bacterium]
MTRWGGWLASGILVLAAVWAYHNSFSAPYILDDNESVSKNSTIRHLWPVWQALTPPHGRPSDGGRPVAGRPVVNLSLAVNYAMGGLAVRGYHEVNLAIHILAGLVLFGLVRRTLLERPTSSFAPFGKRRASEDRP